MATSNRSYMVKPGDTLSRIGARLGVDWRELARINGIANPNLIYPGQVLQMPGVTAPAPVPASSVPAVPSLPDNMGDKRTGGAAAPASGGGGFDWKRWAPLAVGALVLVYFMGNQPVARKRKR